MVEHTQRRSSSNSMGLPANGRTHGLWTMMTRSSSRTAWVQLSIFLRSVLMAQPAAMRCATAEPNHHADSTDLYVTALPSRSAPAPRRQRQQQPTVGGVDDLDVRCASRMLWSERWRRKQACTPRLFWRRRRWQILRVWPLQLRGRGGESAAAGERAAGCRASGRSRPLPTARTSPVASQ